VWDNIDLNDCTIFIERTLKRVKMPDGTNKTTLKFRKPKTKKSKSKVAFPEWIKDELIRHHWEQVATLLLENGEEMKEIQELLRHSRLSTASDIYTAWTDKLQKKTATRIGEILRPPSVPGRSPAPGNSQPDNPPSS
jgi:integrase